MCPPLNFPVCTELVLRHSLPINFHCTSHCISNRNKKRKIVAPKRINSRILDYTFNLLTMINLYIKVMNYFGDLIPDVLEGWLLVGEERKGFS